MHLGACNLLHCEECIEICAIDIPAFLLERLEALFIVVSFSILNYG